MGHEENYCIWSCISIGGFPLEEESEQERIPSIIGSIVWCCPTSRVLIIINWWFSILFHIYCVVIIFIYLWYYCDILYSGIWLVTSSIRTLSLADIVGKYFLFLQFFFFFRRRKKRAVTFQKFLVYFCEKFVETGCRSELLSEKHPS
jgi:hypothetical protein